MNGILDSRQLRAFLRLARTGSFTLTARDLNLSQSAVSHSMRALEEDLGCRLFDRMGKRVMLTHAGERLLPHAETILTEMTAARLSLREMEQWGQTRLRTAASVTACQFLLPAVLREFKESFPRCEVTVLPGDTPDSIHMLRENAAEIGIGLQPENQNDLAFVEMFEDELVFLTSPQHPWARKGRVNRREIADQTCILYSKSSYTFRLVRNFFAAEDAHLKNVMELGNMNAILELVKLGIGVTIMAPWTARQEIECRAVVSLPLGRGGVRRQWGLFHLRGRRLSLAETTFAELCANAGHNLELAQAA